MERDNRKSHLAPQLSPATQDLLRATDSPTDRHPLETPTSGDIPIGRAGIPAPREGVPAPREVGREREREREREQVVQQVQVPAQHEYARGAAGQSFSLPVRMGPPARNGGSVRAVERERVEEDSGRRGAREARYGVAPPYGYYPSG